MILRIIAWLWSWHFRRCACGVRFSEVRIVLDTNGAFVEAQVRCPTHDWIKVTR